MKLGEIHLRDPYILLDGDMYYLYGTTVFMGPAEHFICYKSSDLKDWEGPVEIFRRTADFWADQCFWAPECYAHDGKYYFLTTMGSNTRKKGIQVLKSGRPDGRYVPLTDVPLTPPEWTCIDGTLYWEGQTPYLVFSHSFEDGQESAMCAMAMSEDLKSPAGEIFSLFEAREAPWGRPCPWGKAEFGLDGDIYLADGPCLYKSTGGALMMVWSSWGETGYTVGVAHSSDGTLRGSWTQDKTPLFKEGGGHGMIFADKSGKTYYVLHSPNEPSMERPRIYEIEEKGGTIVLK